MNKMPRYSRIGAIGYAVVSCLLSVWYLILPGDQLILIGLLSLPADIPLLMILAPLRLSVSIQTILIVLAGMVQYGVIGYVIDLHLQRRGNLPSNEE